MGLTHISLFSGIGGDTLAAEWAGFETVLFVENDSFCQKVLNKHWPDVPIIGDIKDATKETMANATQFSNSQLCNNGNGQSYKEPTGESGRGSICRRSGIKEDRESILPITLITGGFPCQPVSVAGKQRGKEDDRWLWPEMLRVLAKVRPRWVVAENVAGLIRMGIDDCISDLENIGYTTESYLIPACSVNAPHRRDRIFIVAYSQCVGWNERASKGIQQAIQESEGQELKYIRKGISRSQDVADTNRERPQGYRGLRECGGQWLTWQGSKPPEEIWELEPDVGRVAHGISSRVDRLKALGNAIVPQQIYPILKAIADMELKV